MHRSSCPPQPKSNQSLNIIEISDPQLPGEYSGISDRNFIEVSYEKLFTIPDTTDIFLYDPYPVSVDRQGNLYVIDSGIRKVLKFSHSGEYLVSYGENGAGEGPGEFLNIIDFGITSDSIVYVADTYGHKVAFF